MKKLKTAVVTDSTSNIPQALRENLPIVIVPITIILGGQVFKDEVDLTVAEFYRRQAQNPEELFSTACPSIGEFVEAYRQAATMASGIVSVHIGTGLSSTCSAAVQGAELFHTTSEGRDIPVEIVDTGTVSMALGFSVLAAARAAQAGLPLPEVAARARSVVSKVRMYALVKTLRGVAKSGRAPSVVRYFVARIPVYPVLEVAGGKTRLVRPERSYKRAIKRMLDITSGTIGSRTVVDLAVMHAAAPEEAYAILEELKQRHPCRETVVTEFTPVMGAYTGPGLLGVTFYPVEDELTSGP